MFTLLHSQSQPKLFSGSRFSPIVWSTYDQGHRTTWHQIYSHVWNHGWNGSSESWACTRNALRFHAFVRLHLESIFMELGGSCITDVSTLGAKYSYVLVFILGMFIISVGFYKSSNLTRTTFGMISVLYMPCPFHPQKHRKERPLRGWWLASERGITPFVRVGGAPLHLHRAGDCFLWRVQCALRASAGGRSRS